MKSQEPQHSTFHIPYSITDLHHAYLVEGDKEGVLPELHAALEERGFPTRANPDLWVEEFDLFTIDDARELRRRAAQKAVGGQGVFVVCINVFPHEAQNALLKVLEDPAPNTHFFFIMPRVSSLLPTLRSRFHFVKAEEAEAKGGVDARAFLKANPAERFKLLEPIIKEKDKQAAIRFLNALEEELVAKQGLALRRSPDASVRATGKGEALRSKELVEQADVLTEIQKARGYLSDRAPSVKMLLEYVALSTPRAK